MNLLETQEQFEKLWFLKSSENTLDGMRSDRVWIVYFTAAWCAPCKKLNLEQILNEASKKQIPVWKCDETVNNYTGGYCGIRKLPTFTCMKPKQILSTLSNNDTETVMNWIRELPDPNSSL